MKQISKNAKFIVNKFLESPGKFASAVLQLYWNAEKERDAYKSERDTLIDDIAKLREERDKYKAKHDVLISDIAVLCKQYDNIKDKLDKVVRLFDTHIAYKQAWSDNLYYDKLQNELNKIMEDE